MNDQENQLIREATGQNRDFEEPEPEETNDSNETGDDEQGEILQTNTRTWKAIAAVRIERNPATMSELYDALNARNYSRNARLTRDERDALSLEYLKQHAPDLIATINQPAMPQT